MFHLQSPFGSYPEQAPPVAVAQQPHWVSVECCFIDPDLSRASITLGGRLALPMEMPQRLTGVHSWPAGQEFSVHSWPLDPASGPGQSDSLAAQISTPTQQTQSFEQGQGRSFSSTGLMQEQARSRTVTSTVRRMARSFLGSCSFNVRRPVPGRIKISRRLPPPPRSLPAR